MTFEDLHYDPTNPESIEEYAQVLVGSTLREHIDADKIDNPKYRKGSFGNAIEYHFFKYDINNDSRPDFPEAGLELKTTPVKKTKKDKIVAKERLVLSMINYNDVVKETWETSSVLKKAKDILLISYMYEPALEPLDYEIVVAMRWGIPEQDYPMFKQDWETVVNKIRNGKAHEISGSDTLYLEACTKASKSTDRRKQPFSSIPSKPRAWAIKNSYMTTVQNKLISKMQRINRDESEKDLSLYKLVYVRFSHFFGLTEKELGTKFGYITKGKRAPKNLCALITRKILGVEKDAKIEEFEKAGIKPKTIRIKKSGMLKESVSFPYFDYCKLVETSFEDSEFKSYLDTKFLFVIYDESSENKNEFILSDIVFWQMKDDDIDFAKKCYEDMRKRVADKRAHKSVKSSENPCCHVRPHGRNSSDTCLTPYGEEVVKKSFWLNASYLAKEIKRKRTMRNC